MIEVPSLVAVFAAEALIGLFLLVAGFSLYSARKKSARRSVADDLVEKLDTETNIQSDQLKDLLLESCGIDESTFEEFMRVATDNEKQLYSHIVSMFLKHDPELLATVGKPIHALTEPYRELVIAASNTQKETPAASMETEQEITRLGAECQRLAAQLGMALETVDGVCSEYSNLLGQTKSAAELEASCERMLTVFKQATQIVTATGPQNQIEREAEAEEI